MQAYELSPLDESAQPNQATNMSCAQYPRPGGTAPVIKTHKSHYAVFLGSDESAIWEESDD